ncbi:MAG: hypothetical protein Q8N18_08355, partial [Opitutaceae bacterium]|nr:hypothetical protein [Opitutaceae bacterium]
MTPLPRFIAMALFIVLLALVGLLAVPLWQDTGTEPRERPPGAAEGVAGAQSARARVLAQRI